MAYDSAGCARSDVKMQLGKCAWPEEKEKALPAPRGTAYPRCLGNASCSPPQGAGGSNTRTKFVIRELLIHTSTEHRRCRNTGPGTQGGSSLIKDMKCVQAGTQTPQGRKFCVSGERDKPHSKSQEEGGILHEGRVAGWLRTTYTDSLIPPPQEVELSSPLLEHGLDFVIPSSWTVCRK